MIYLYTVLTVIPAAAQQAPDTLFLDVREAIHMALAESPEVAIDASGVAFSEARAAQARAARYLTIAHLTTGHSVAPGLLIPEDNPPPMDALYLDPRVRNDWENLRPYSEAEVEILQPLLTFGELSGQIRAADAAIEVDRAATDVTSATVALRAAELVGGLQATVALSGLVDDAERMLRMAGEELRQLLDDGDPSVSDADWFQFRLFEQELHRRRVEVDQQRALAESALARLIRHPGYVVRITTPVETFPVVFKPLEDLQEEALVHRAELRQANAGVRARQAQVDVARSHYYPSVFLGVTVRGRYTFGRERQPNPFISDTYLGGTVRAGIGLRQDLSFHQTRSRVQQAEAQLSEVRYQQEAVEQLVLFEVEEAYRNMVIARAALDSADESATIAAEWLRLEQINFDLGFGDVKDLIAAARADLETRIARIDAVRRYNTTVFRLLDAQGILVGLVNSGTLFDFIPVD